MSPQWSKFLLIVVSVISMVLNPVDGRRRGKRIILGAPPPQPFPFPVPVPFPVAVPVQQLVNPVRHLSPLFVPISPLISHQLIKIGHHHHNHVIPHHHLSHSLNHHFLNHNSLNPVHGQNNFVTSKFDIDWSLWPKEHEWKQLLNGHDLNTINKLNHGIIG